MIGHDPHPLAGGQQFLPLGIGADGGQDRGRHAEAAQRHGDVHRDAAGQAGDPARHIGAQLHMAR